MEKVVCQRCPITPYLYLFVVHVLGYMICDPRYGIEGLTPLDGTQIRNQMFTYHTMMFLKGNPNNLRRHLKFFKHFVKLQEGRLISISHVPYGLPRRIDNGIGGRQRVVLVNIR